MVQVNRTSRLGHPTVELETADICSNVVHCCAGSRHYTMFDIGRIQDKAGSLEKAAASYHETSKEMTMVGGGLPCHAS